LVLKFLGRTFTIDLIFSQRLKPYKEMSAGPP